MSSASSFHLPPRGPATTSNRKPGKRGRPPESTPRGPPVVAGPGRRPRLFSSSVSRQVRTQRRPQADRILYHGWADQSIPPWSTLDYYAAVERAGGGFPASQAFSRLYMIPGAYHCLVTPDPAAPGGIGSINRADFLTPLISWVQHGTAPATIQANTLSLITNKITLRQKMRPYNALAKVTPAPGSLNGHYHYLGTYP